MKHSRFLFPSSHLLRIISTMMTKQENATSLATLVSSPRPPLQSLPFAPPPKWAAELARRLQKRFPELCRRHHILYMRSFIHPSFTTPDAVTSTMAATASLGESLLLSVGTTLMANTFKDLKRDEILLLASFILSDAALSSVLRRHWELEDLVLTDASVKLFHEKTLGSTAGMLQWLSGNGGKQIPDPYSAGSVKSMIGAVYLDEGLDSAISFINKHVIQLLE